MKPGDIVVGGKFSNNTDKYGGVRIVDVILERNKGQVAVVWRNALAKSASDGHEHGVSLLSTFARWARNREEMTADELAKHRRCADFRAQNVAKNGALVNSWLERTN